MFTPSFINSNGAFAYFLNLFLDPSKTGLYEQQITAIQNLYSSIVDPHARASQVIRDSSFTCNTRYLFDAYSSSSSVYMMDYEFFANPSIPGVPPLAFHGADLLPLFYFKGIDTVAIWTQVSKSYPQVTQAQVNQFMNLVGMLSPGYQRYFVSLAVSGDGDPNTFNKILQPTWSVATVNGDTSLGNVNQVFLDPPLSDFHTHSTDNINIENPWCSFWANMSGWLEATAPSEVKDKNGQGTVTWFKHELRI